MEHWSGVMAWEVRRLEKASSQAQARYAQQQRQANTYKDREEAMRRQFTELEQDLQHRTGRVAELEEIVVEMGQRERAIEDEIKQLDEERGILEKERHGWSGEKQSFAQERSAWERDKRAFEAEKRQWETERGTLVAERDAALRDRQKSLDSGRMSDRDRATMDMMRSGLGGILGRKSGSVAEAEIIEAVEEVKKLVERREKEVCTLRDEMREVNTGLEEEVRRVRADRDAWKTKVERGDLGKKDEMGQLEKKLRVGFHSLSSEYLLTK
jgi:chromosome segregation ATPase